MSAIRIGEYDTGYLPAGNVLTVTPVSSALVSLSFSDATALGESISVEKRYGPYPQSLTWWVTAIAGAVNVVDSKLQSPLLVEGWEDLRFPAQGINPAGAADAPSVDNVLTDYPGTLLFSGSADNIIAGIAQMPHSWKRGTAIRPHIHWSKPVGSASATTWVMYYRVLGSVGDVHGALVGPVAVTATYGTPGTSNSMLISSFGEIDLSDQKESTCLAWQIRRLGSTDADNGTARLFEFDIHYQKNKSGSVNEIPD